ncbi:hypothetical protein tb265_28920 [Gemmatimonadetes bacterium T265]|nr:hypothetical protein tb265_28920 [Gemmatimonadetes bacterium T265]
MSGRPWDDAGDDAVSQTVAGVLGSFGARAVVLAVSGGRDSMVLLRAAATAAPASIRAVATFDHGTGVHAESAVSLVRETANALGVPLVSGRAAHPARTEAGWRTARWRFLRAVAADVRVAAVATAHTADDQIETAAMRVLRCAGARGLAALAAPSATIVRPLLTLSRARVAEYAAAHDVRWIDDPGNEDRRHLRVRLRADLLPAIDRVCPGTTAGLTDLAARAARWRNDVDAWAAALGAYSVECDAAPDEATPRDARLSVGALAGLSPDALAVFWPTFAARGGVRLDRRGLARLVAYTARVVARVNDGTVQPARVPVADDRSRRDGALGTPHVTLVYDADPAAEGRRSWQFVVARGASCAPDVDHVPAVVGVAPPDSSDYT